MAARVTSQADHLKPWMEGNENHRGLAQLKDEPSAAWEAEVRRLTELGIHPQELRIYKRTVTSWNEKINKLNDEITSKLNSIARCRRVWLELKLRRGGKKEMEGVLNDAESHHQDIKLLQKRVTSLGGHFEQIPVLFDDVPSV